MSDELVAEEIYRLEQAAQRGAEERIAALRELVYDDADFDDPRWNEVDQAGPFCGCDTCEVREILDAAWPHLLEAARIVIRNEEAAAVGDDSKIGQT